MTNYDLSAVRDPSGRVLEGAEKHVAVLQRRANYLRTRIDRGRRDGKDMTYDEQELDALVWAIRELDDFAE